MIRWLGVICILGSCGYVGFSMAGRCLGEIRSLEMLDRSLELMICQMEYRLTDIPELCDILSSACSGPVRKVFLELGKEVQKRDTPNAAVAMALAIERTPELPPACGEILQSLSTGLGKMDLAGELRDLEYARSQVKQNLEARRAGREGRVKSYRVLGLCGGAALAILLL